MQLSVTVTGTKQLEHLRRNVRPASRAGLRHLAVETRKVLVNEVETTTYARKIPTMAQVRAYNKTQGVSNRGHSRRTRRGNRLAWKRTGKLRRKIRVAVSKAGGAFTMTMTINLPYARRREGLGADWRPKRPALGIVRRDIFIRRGIRKAQAIAPREFGKVFFPELLKGV